MRANLFLFTIDDDCFILPGIARRKKQTLGAVDSAEFRRHHNTTDIPGELRCPLRVAIEEVRCRYRAGIEEARQHCLFQEDTEVLRPLQAATVALTWIITTTCILWTPTDDCIMIITDLLVGLIV